MADLDLEQDSSLVQVFANEDEVPSLCQGRHIQIFIKTQQGIASPSNHAHKIQQANQYPSLYLHKQQGKTVSEAQANPDFWSLALDIRIHLRSWQRHPAITTSLLLLFNSSQGEYYNTKGNSDVMGFYEISYGIVVVKIPLRNGFWMGGADVNLICTMGLLTHWLDWSVTKPRFHLHEWTLSLCAPSSCPPTCPLSYQTKIYHFIQTGQALICKPAMVRAHCNIHIRQCFSTKGDVQQAVQAEEGGHELESQTLFTPQVKWYNVIEFWPFHFRLLVA